jgi:hypothetical protein
MLNSVQKILRCHSEREAVEGFKANKNLDIKKSRQQTGFIL